MIDMNSSIYKHLSYLLYNIYDSGFIYWYIQISYIILWKSVFAYILYITMCVCILHVYSMMCVYVYHDMFMSMCDTYEYCVWRCTSWYAVSEWVSEWVSQSVSQSVSEWVSECLYIACCECITCKLCVRVCECGMLWVCVCIACCHVYVCVQCVACCECV